ncbi:hypothetical protein Lal_00020553 [Lupinus albus]|uniref:GPI inositol-deacylase n=1 Tax=Lupinus albus TaxID=3870 RepID=A0A6A5MH27_LUPAL|nr:putative GPI inositol-deacylase PGAP1, alpha/Beta hydrolase [Lupinus albus]KAF1871758.1 hypothetical protein Lal_00020553 [Lupinus albus]
MWKEMKVGLCVSVSPPKCSISSSNYNVNYRPAVILPGLGNNSSDYKKLKESLKDKYGVATVVAKVSRVDWLRNASGLLDSNYWSGTLKPTPILLWYLKRVDDAVEEAKQLSSSNPSPHISFIGHSAGGWLARLYIQQFPASLSHISLLLTLGTPHLPPPKGVIDQTRGLLHYVHQNCPKPLHHPQLKYVCVAGRYIEGAPLFGKSNTDSDIVTTTTTAPPRKITLRARIVGQGYKQVCGKAEVWGDGIVPEESAHLEGAINISLDGIYHSPLASDDHFRPWYGSPAALDQWVQHLLI